MSSVERTVPSMTTRLFLGLAALAAVAVAPFGLSAAPQLTSIVPASAPVVLHVRSMADLRASWKGTSFARAWEDPEIRKFFGPTIDAMNDPENGPFASIQRDTGMEPDDFFALFSGEAILAVKDIGPYFRDEEDENPQLLIAVECGPAMAKILEMLERAASATGEKGGKEVTEEFQGETLHITMNPSEDEAAPPTEGEAWAIVDGIFLVAEPKSVLQEAIVAIKKGGTANPLADHPAFVSLYRNSPDTHMVMHLGLDGIMAGVTGMLESTAGMTDPDGNPVGPAATLAQMGLTPQGLFRTLGLDALQSLDLSVAFRERGTVVEGDLAWTEQRGLLRMAAVGEPPVPRLPFVPDSWVLAGVDLVSVRDAYAALMTTLADVSPEFEAKARAQVKNTGAQLGIDVERDFIGSLGDTMVAGYAVPPGPEEPGRPLDQFIAISLSNPDAFRTSVDAIFNRLPFGRLLQSREYLGETIRTIAIPRGKAFSFAITRGYFLLSIGSPAMVESAIQGMQEGSAAKPFWKKPEVVKALDALPDGASSVLVADLGRVMGLAVDFLVENTAKARAAAEAAADAEVEGVEPATTMPILVDPSARPSAETIAKYWTMMSRGLYRTKHGFHLILTFENGR
ncbi:MAG: hypothetical protein IAE82_14945 [Opitutaceae bacterium]|nr:hypothetical protein [Opitutaceae bacterium]